MRCEMQNFELICILVKYRLSMIDRVFKDNYFNLNVFRATSYKIHLSIIDEN